MLLLYVSHKYHTTVDNSCYLRELSTIMVGVGGEIGGTTVRGIQKVFTLERGGGHEKLHIQGGAWTFWPQPDFATPPSPIAVIADNSVSD